MILGIRHVFRAAQISVTIRPANRPQSSNQAWVFLCRFSTTPHSYGTRIRVDDPRFQEMEVRNYKSKESYLRTYVFGNARTGALGIAEYLRPLLNSKQQQILKKRYPTRLPFCELTQIKFKQLSCGYGFTLFLCQQRDMQNNQVYGTGVNTESQLGFHKPQNKNDKRVNYLICPTPIDLPLRNRTAKVLQVAAGRAHSLFLTEEGCFSAGSNSYGQCGREIIEDEDYANRPTIHRIADLPDDVTQITCGEDTSYFITSKGDVYSCGWGADGQTGLGAYDVNCSPRPVRGAIAGEKIIQLSSTADCVLALSEKGEVFGWGNSEYRQLAVVTDFPQTHTPVHLPFRDVGKVISVSAGGTTCGLVNDAGMAYVWGYGYLGKGPELKASVVPTILPPTLFQAVEFNESNPVKTITCGLMHHVIVTVRGDLYAWGANDFGQLGLGDITRQYFPLRVQIPARVNQVSLGVDHTALIASPL